MPTMSHHDDAAHALARADNQFYATRRGPARVDSGIVRAGSEVLR